MQAPRLSEPRGLGRKSPHCPSTSASLQGGDTVSLPLSEQEGGSFNIRVPDGEIKTQGVECFVCPSSLLPIKLFREMWKGRRAIEKVGNKSKQYTGNEREMVRWSLPWVRVRVGDGVGVKFM